MATTTVQIKVVGDMLAATPSSVPVVPGDSVVLQAPSSAGARLCMGQATAGVFDPPAILGAEVAAGGSLTLYFSPEAAGAHMIGLLDPAFECPFKVDGPSTAGVLSIVGLMPGHEGPGGGTEGPPNC